MDVPYDVKAGDPYPGQDWYNGVLACIRRLRLIPARDSGLSKVEGPFGTTLSVTFPPPAYLGITTTPIGPRSGKTPGTGTVQPYGWNGTQLYILGSPLQVRNWTGSTIGTNLWIEYNYKYGIPWFNGNDCSGVAP
jgi:hypothetical protein